MTGRSGFIKVRVWSPMNPDKNIISRNEVGSLRGSPEFKDASYEADARFREPIITFINEAIGLQNWAILFEQYDETGKIFEANIYCDDQDYLKICSIIEKRITDFKFKFRKSGTIDDYLHH